ncbi:hypothetical protein [Halorussus halophilus]|uniref:hypothetical protein n=1 Tax=Halorussus halophilus TaxID=2650975 RepID=UPI001300EC70|nr:hypothetical protein [Halorussus halophilus]
MLPRDAFDRTTLVGAAILFAAVALVAFALPVAYRSDLSQVSLVAVAVSLVGFGVEYRGSADPTRRKGLRAGAIGGGLCVFLVAAQAATKQLDYLPIIAASAVVLPVTFGVVGHVSGTIGNHASEY